MTFVRDERGGVVRHPALLFELEIDLGRAMSCWTLQTALLLVRPGRGAGCSPTAARRIKKKFVAPAQAANTSAAPALDWMTLVHGE